jgi:hypothetical protein
VRAAVAQRVETPIDIEHPNRPAGDVDDQPLAGRDIRHVCYDMAVHGWSSKHQRARLLQRVILSPQAKNLVHHEQIELETRFFVPQNDAYLTIRCS